MATTEALSDPDEIRSDVLQDDFEYRPLSGTAIASAVFGVLSVLTFVAGKDSLQSCMLLCPIPLVGLTAGLKSLATFRSMPGQLSGRNAALAGVVLSTIGLIGGVSYASYVHATEVPDGYTRTSFSKFRPDEIEQRSRVLVPRDVYELDGQKVFIKGYIRPGTTVTRDGTPVRRHVGRFLLVRDNNECCFGDQSKVKYFDQILVTLVGSLTIDDSRRLLRVGGTLHSDPQRVGAGIGRPVYSLEADYVQ